MITATVASSGRNVGCSITAGRIGRGAYVFYHVEVGDRYRMVLDSHLRLCAGSLRWRVLQGRHRSLRAYPHIIFIRLRAAHEYPPSPATKSSTGVSLAPVSETALRLSRKSDGLRGRVLSFWSSTAPIRKDLSAFGRSRRVSARFLGFPGGSTALRARSEASRST